MLGFLGVPSGEFARAPRKGIPGRGLHGAYGQRGSDISRSRTALVDAICVPRRCGDRMGVGGAAREHQGHQREWNVYRMSRHTLGGCGIYSKDETRSADETRLFGEADRARAGDGRDGGIERSRKPPAISKASFDSFCRRFLTFQIAPYTIQREKLSICIRDGAWAAGGFCMAGVSEEEFGERE